MNTVSDKIPLVCCSYDGYILEEMGHESQINQEYTDPQHVESPSLTRVSSTTEALEALARDDSFDFILTMYNVGEPDVFHSPNRQGAAGIPIPQRC